jgi:23S rRNA pseudouridine1911/1915/1917 synthase
LIDRGQRARAGTTGLMVICRTDAALSRLGAQFAARRVRRVYHGVTAGVPRARAGEVRTNIGRHKADRKRMAAYTYGCGQGREAVSSYRRAPAGATARQHAGGRRALRRS